MALTAKEKAVCEEYVANGCRASTAYATVYGCSYHDAKGRYRKTFKKQEVQDYIKALQQEAFQEACITAERVAIKLADIAFADKEDEIYIPAHQLKALDLLQKQLGLQKQHIDADLKTDITIEIE
jgi:phage terminase small subunit